MDPFISLLLVLLPLSFFASCDGLIWRVRPSSTAITVGQPISIRAIASGIQRAGQWFPTCHVSVLIHSRGSCKFVTRQLHTAVSQYRAVSGNINICFFCQEVRNPCTMRTFTLATDGPGNEKAPSEKRSSLRNVDLGTIWLKENGRRDRRLHFLLPPL